MKDGKTIIGKLTAARETNLLVESIVEGGVVGLSYAVEDMNSVEVLLQAGEELYVPEEPQTPEGESVIDSPVSQQEDTLSGDTSAEPIFEDVLEGSAPTATENVIPEIIDNTLDTVQETPLGSAVENQE